MKEAALRGSVKSASVRGALRREQDSLLFFRQILREIFGKSFCSNRQKTLRIGPEFSAKRSRRIRLTDAGYGLTVSWRESGYKDEPDNFRVVPCPRGEAG